jgi:hypothetical protein
MLNQQRISNKISVVNQQRKFRCWSATEYLLLIYIFSNWISATDNPLLKN